ncbi:MAG: esterase [Acidimicrobiales bacterium]|nr:esterase [Acidimicrobiales bacterium]
MGLLSNWFLGALVAATVIASAALVLVERRRRRRLAAGELRRLRAALTRVGSAALVVVLLLVCGLDQVNRHFAYVPSFAALFGNPSPDLLRVSLNQAAPHGRKAAVAGHGVDVKVVIPGPLSGITRSAYVYLPPQYFDPAWAQHRFPVLYLIHGSPGTAIDWIRGGRVDRTADQLLARHRINPLIVVMPDANGGYMRDLQCQNVPRGPQDQTYLSSDVVRWADTHLRTVADRWHRAIGGLSTGGYCGVNLAFRHQDVFSAAVSHSGSGEPDHSRFTANIFGGRADLAWANTPVRYLPQLPIRPGMAVYLDSGMSDSWSLSRSTRLNAVLRARGVPTTFHRMLHEGHSFASFARDTNFSLLWLSQWFAQRSAPTVTDVVARPPDARPAPAIHHHHGHRGLRPAPARSVATTRPSSPRP